jgi:phosphatidylglycerophosphate synthase
LPSESIEAALICVPSRGGNKIFGRTLLERLLLMCERAGIKRYFIEASPEARAGLLPNLGRFRDHPLVCFVESFDRLTNKTFALRPRTPCLAFRGNVVFGRSHLMRVIHEHAAKPLDVVTLVSLGGDLGGRLAVGPLDELIKSLGSEEGSNARKLTSMSVDLPYALDGHPQDREEAELRVARAIREESAGTDGIMARVFDRKLSWRISLKLARTSITPNQVTLANTALGIAAAVMFASTSYWMRLMGSILFALSITIDGVDGELARLKMVESEAGRRLDVTTDNIVHVAIFVGLMTGCYRISHSASYGYLLLIMLGGFAACAVSVNRAMSLNGARAKRWVDRIDRVTGRDFAYILVVLAIFDSLKLFAWGAAFGTYVFAIVLWVLTSIRLMPKSAPLPQRASKSGMLVEEL